MQKQDETLLKKIHLTSKNTMDLLQEQLCWNPCPVFLGGLFDQDYVEVTLASILNEKITLGCQGCQSQFLHNSVDGFKACLWKTLVPYDQPICLRQTGPQTTGIEAIMMPSLKVSLVREDLLTWPL